MTLRSLALVSATLLLQGAGCDNLKWNWDLEWWKQPSRIVRPDRSRQPTQAEEPNPTPVSEVEEHDLDDQGVETTDSTPQTSTDLHSASARPFYHLHLLSGEEAQSKPNDGSHHRLRNIDARSCAKLLEMLYVPLGRSGNDAQTYLIFEERDEFDAAGKAAAMLDVQPGGKTAIAANTGASFEEGIGCFYQIIKQGAIVDRNLVDRCERRLAQAAQSSQLSDQKRWAAAVLNGRLLSEYRYDYAGARRYYDQARLVAKRDSTEPMTIDWWLADSLTQEGNIREANKVYKNLLETYAQRWPQSQIVTRSRSILDG